MEQVLQPACNAPDSRASYRRTALLSAVAMFLVPFTSMAGTVTSGDPFSQFLQAVNNYAHGALGISLCIVALLFGGIVGIGRNQPTAALSGVAFAIFIYFGPGVIFSIFNAGAVLA